MRIFTLMCFLMILDLSALELKRTSSGELFLHAKSKKILNEELLALESWTVKTSNSCSFGDIKRKFPGGFKVNVTNCLPSHVRLYHHVKPEIAGPNCWNLSLVMADLVPSLRFSTREEMKFYMNEPFCSLVSNEEGREAGDIIAIRKNNNREVHGMVYISDRLVYSKNGYSKRKPYAIQELENVLEIYKVSSVKKCFSNQSSTEEGCNPYVQFYRCQSLDSYLDRYRDEINIEIIEVHMNLNQLEQLIANLYFENNSISIENLEEVFEKSEEIFLSTSEKKLGSENLNNEEARFLSMMKEKSKSMSSALLLISKNSRDQDIRNKIYRIRIALIAIISYL